MRLKSLLAGLLFGAILVPAAAHAANGYVSEYGAVRAGPSADYPQIVILDRGNPIQIYGCLDRWNWCDVSFRGYRGWMRADKIAYGYGGRWMPVPGNGPRAGIPILNFSFDYWDSHYRTKSFYRQRDVYVRKHPEYRGRRDYDRDRDRDRRKNDKDRDRAHRNNHNARPVAAPPRPRPSHPSSRPGQSGKQGGDRDRNNRGHGADRGHGPDRGHSADRGRGGDQRPGSYPSGPPVAKR